MVDLKSIARNDLYYIIGIIATDGNLSKDERHITITSKHEGHLLDIRESLHLKNKLIKKARGYSKEKKYSVLAINDIAFYKYLEGIGLHKKKSLTLEQLKIDKKYFRDFLRGVIDGDGCISSWINKDNQHQQWSLRIVSAAPVFIDWLKKEIEDYFLVKGRLYKYNYGGKRNFLHTLKFGKLPAKIILQGIYYTGCLCLKTKNKKNLSCLQDENKMINYRGIICSGAEIGRQP